MSDLRAQVPFYWSNFAGQPGGPGTVDGTGTAARFNSPARVAVGKDGNLYVADNGNHTIRRVSPAGVVTLFAGMAGEYGNADGMGAAARFHYPSGLAFDSQGNLFVTDDFNHTIRKITPAGEVTTFAGKAGISGSADGMLDEVRFNRPVGLSIDANDNLFVTERDNHTVRKITPNGEVTTVAGSAGSEGSADGTRVCRPLQTAYGHHCRCQWVSLRG